MMLSLAQRNSLEQATQTYTAHLPQALAYLEGRGITEQTARTYRLGYVAPTQALLGDEQFSGRLAIPFLATGGVVSMRFRSIDGREPKYLSRQGDQTTLFSVTSLMEDVKQMVITEGEVDAMTLNQCGIPSVGVTGAKAWKSHYRLLFQDYDRVLIACDGDQAGREFGKQVAEYINGAIPVVMPDGEDVNSVYVKNGEGKLRELLRLGE